LTNIPTSLQSSHNLKFHRMEIWMPMEVFIRSYLKDA
jgi:hypothetical protein